MGTFILRWIQKYYGLNVPVIAPGLQSYRSRASSRFNSQLFSGVRKVHSHVSSYPTLLDEELVNNVEKNFWNTHLSQVMSERPREVYVVEGEVTVLDAVQHMLSNDLESIQVVASKNPEATLLGVFSERNFLQLLASQDGLQLRQLRLKDVVRKQIGYVVCGLYESIRNCVYLMKKHNIHLIPLVLRPNQPFENIMNRDCAQILSTTDIRNFLLLHSSRETLRWLELVTVGDILRSMNRESRNTDHLVSVDPQEVVADACRTMIERKVGCAVVGTWEETSPLKPYPNSLTFLTQRDIIASYIKSYGKTLELPVADAVSCKTVRVSSPNYTVFQVLEMLSEDDSRYSPVFSTDERDSQDLTSSCLALLSTKDVLIHCLMMFPSK